MTNDKNNPLWTVMGLLFRSHPWHGVPLGPDAPNTVTAYIEMTPADTCKYELDKVTGIMKMDRPQLYSSQCPVLYGLMPQTYCAEQIGAFCEQQAGIEGIQGDGDPLDICVLSEKHIARGNILMRCKPIGGLRMIDGNEADDKIIAVMEGDPAYERWNDVSDCPASMINRLRHYFLTYKQGPDTPQQVCQITHIYGREEAFEVIRHSVDDYNHHYAGLQELLEQALQVDEFPRGMFRSK